MFKVILKYLILLIITVLDFNSIEAQNNEQELVVRINEAKDIIGINNDSAQYILEDLYHKTQINRDYYSTALITKYLGDLHSNFENYRKAIGYYYEALFLLNQIDSIKNMASVHQSLGTNYMYLGESDHALDEFLSALRIAEKFNDTKELINCYQNLGLFYNDMYEYQIAKNYYSLALSIINNQQKYYLQQAAILQNIGIIYSQRGVLDTAISYYKSSLKIFTNEDDKTNIATSYNNLGVLFERQEQRDSTLYYYKKALTIFEEINYKQGVSVSLYNIGNIYHNLKKYQLALNYYQQSLSISRSIELRDNNLNTLNEISDVYASMGNYKLSRKYLHDAYHLHDSINALTKSTRIAKLAKIYETEKKEKNILRLEKEREQRRTIMVFLISSVIFMFLLIIFAFIYYKIRQKALIVQTIALEQKKQFKAVLKAQEEERKRVATELHDSIGPLLSVTRLYISDLADTVKETSKENTQLFDKSLEILNDACQETRDISHNLMPGVLIRSGLGPACKELVERINNIKAFKITFTNQGYNKRLDETIEVSFYRVLQELLNNIIKHSEATEVKVMLASNNGHISLIVSDNGIGLDLNKVNKSKGIGLQSIYSRLSLINGDIKIESKPRKGTQFKLSAPIES